MIWKNADISLLNKRHEKSNYRALSIRPLFSKLSECRSCVQIDSHT